MMALLRMLPLNIWRKRQKRLSEDTAGVDFAAIYFLPI
jgi:hypothetical protein